MESSFPEAKILIIDDEQGRIDLLKELFALDAYHNVVGLTDAGVAWEVFAEELPDLVLLDLHMGAISGFDVLRQLQPFIKDAFLPILVLTGDASKETREKALAEGAKDFVAKPFNTTEILLRVRNLLHTRKLYLQLEEQKGELEQRVKERTAELETARNEVLERLARAADYRDDDTGEHTKRVGGMARAIALELGIAGAEAELIGKAALLHDIGKIGIPDHLLLKDGKLTPEEFEKVKEHTVIGSEILSGSDSKLLQVAQQISLMHHERWDGTGYTGVAGEEIPIEARIVAVADVYDALTSSRPYKEAWSVEDSVKEIASKSGTQFDPKVVEAFLRVMPEANPNFTEKTTVFAA